MPGTPITPIPTLPTISEVKGPEHGGSSGGSSESGDAKPVPERRKSRIHELKEESAREKLEMNKASGGGGIKFYIIIKKRKLRQLFQFRD